MSEYYDMDGKTIRQAEWSRLWTIQNRKLKHTTLKNGKYVSTVWLGLDHGYGNEPPQIFESMVFDANGGELDCRRYSTMIQALAGHEALCVQWAQPRRVRRKRA